MHENSSERLGETEGQFVGDVLKLLKTKSKQTRLIGGNPKMMEC